MTTRCRIFLILLAILFRVHGYKILIYSPRFGRSHISFMGRIADILVEEGMDVTMVLPMMNPWIKTNGTKLAKTITVECDDRVKFFFKDDSHIATTWTTKTANPLSGKALMEKVTEVHAYQCEYTIKQTDLLNALKKEKFDLAISPVFDLCAMGLFDEVGIEKHVLVSTTLLWEKVGDIFGAPNLPAVVPGVFNGASNRMSYVERLLNLVQIHFTKWWFNSMRDAEQKVVERVLGKKIDFNEKMAEASFVITNADPLLYFPRPVTERIVNIGGVSVLEPKPLDAYWEDVVTKRDATVLVSFGSVAHSYTMPREMKKALLETFKRFPKVTFIWKYEKDEDNVADGFPNVVTNKWVPQNDLLNHPNLKLFITHAGMNSILEASTRGVPLISIPLFGDQMRNSEMVRRLGATKVVDKGDLFNSDRFEAHIREAQNPSYRLITLVSVTFRHHLGQS